MTGRTRRPLATFWTLLVIPAILAGGQLATSSAAFTATTVNSGNSVGTLTVAPPTNVEAALTVNLLPLLTCRADITWTASSTPEVTGYEVVRIHVADGTVAAGPWTVTGTSHLDDPVPLQLAGSDYEWHVRSMLNAWGSTWQVAVPDNVAACLL